MHELYYGPPTDSGNALVYTNPLGFRVEVTSAPGNYNFHTAISGIFDRNGLIYWPTAASRNGDINYLNLFFPYVVPVISIYVKKPSNGASNGTIEYYDYEVDSWLDLCTFATGNDATYPLGKCTDRIRFRVTSGGGANYWSGDGGSYAPAFDYIGINVADVLSLIKDGDSVDAPIKTWDGTSFQTICTADQLTPAIMANYGVETFNGADFSQLLSDEPTLLSTNFENGNTMNLVATTTQLPIITSYLVSQDGVNYYACKNSVWNLVSPTSYYSKGMSLSELEALGPTEWHSFFTPGNLYIRCVIRSDVDGASCWIKKVTITTDGAYDIPYAIVESSNGLIDTISWQEIQGVEIDQVTPTGTDVRYSFSVDNGSSFLIYDSLQSKWVEVDSSSLGMTLSQVQLLSTEWADILSNSMDVRICLMSNELHSTPTVSRLRFQYKEQGYWRSTTMKEKDVYVAQIFNNLITVTNPGPDAVGLRILAVEGGGTEGTGVLEIIADDNSFDYTGITKMVFPKGTLDVGSVPGEVVYKGGVDVPTLNEVSSPDDGVVISAGATLNFDMDIGFSKYEIRTVSAVSSNGKDLVVSIYEETAHTNLIYQSLKQPSIYDIANVPAMDRDGGTFLHFTIKNEGSLDSTVNFRIKITNLR